MKNILLLIFCITLVFACQQHISVSQSNEYIHPSIKDANRLGIEDKFNQELYHFYKGDYSGVLLKVPNGKINNKGKDSIYVSSIYMDATKVCNRHYRAFIQWTHRIWRQVPPIAPSLLPDTTVWLQQFPNEAIGELLKEHYFRDAAFDYYPVVGVSWEQAQAYALWRTDRINEAILVDRGILAIENRGQDRENNFNSYNYLNMLYDATPGEKPITNPLTGEERIVVESDDILVPNYRLPTSSELKNAAMQVKDYSKNKGLRMFRKKVLDHQKIHPKPSFYDHEQYHLPYAIINENGKAPYYLEGNTDEWAQEKHNTDKLYNWSHQNRKDQNDQLVYFIPIWVQKYYKGIDTTILDKFAQQHSGVNAHSQRGFRCVLPNLW
ncbi:MAG: SUMF1/EgtB/PvdO family nonheme iron enzyme [Aureispira sp.]|nr:SUMF1/EgtB/PvdO family nonheme iron enzyme [Aureispira sp.]